MFRAGSNGAARVTAMVRLIALAGRANTAGRRQARQRTFNHRYAPRKSVASDR
jgi:hypothetical protein